VPQLRSQGFPLCALCDAFSVPVVTIVDTEGFVPSVTDDVAGGIREAARLAATYADATTAKVAVLAGKAVGPVYTALAAADLRIAVTGCTVSALEPSAAVSVLYEGRDRCFRQHHCRHQGQGCCLHR